MAGDWIKMRADLHDDPAVFRLQKILSIDRFSVVGRLHAFWSWCDKHASNGYVTGAPLTLVDEVVTLNGFADALVVVGWLEIDGDRGISIPNFDRHNSKPAKERALTNQRVRKHRAGNADVTEMKRSTVTREEKRREDNNTPYPAGFLSVWDIYPSQRRTGKPKCLEIWVKNRLEAQAPAIALHVEAMKLSPQWQRDSGQYIPTLQTYLNQGRFEDGVPTEQARRLAI
jgi:hypothetical protein